MGLFADPYAKRPHSPSGEKEPATAKRKSPSEARAAADVKYREATIQARQDTSQWQKQYAMANLAWKKEETERRRAKDELQVKSQERVAEMLRAFSKQEPSAPLLGICRSCAAEALLPGAKFCGNCGSAQ